MSELQQAFVRLSLGGLTCSSCLEVEIGVSNYRQAGTFRACLVLTQAAADQPFWNSLFSFEGPSSSTGQVEIDLGSLDAGLETVIWQPVILGQVDHISMDVQTGLVEVEGRDLMARLIDYPLTQTFVNQTSSEIVSALASAAGLLAAVQPTTTIVGQFYQIEHSRASLNTFTRFATAFDVIAYLAQAECFDLWMTGQTLNFAAVSTQTPVSLTIDLSQLGPNSEAKTPIKSLRFDRRVVFDGGAQVTVNSWSSRERVAVTSSYPQTSQGLPNFVFVSPNLSSQAALSKAQSLYADIVRHRLSISGEMTGDLTLMPRCLVQIIGSQGWDGNYVVDSVTRQISAERGFTQNFVARAQ